MMNKDNRNDKIRKIAKRKVLHSAYVQYLQEDWQQEALRE